MWLTATQVPAKGKKVFWVFALIYAQISSHSHKFPSITIPKYTEGKTENNPTTNQVLTYNLMNFK